jgi:acyl-CoA dehydrogenase
VKRFEDAGRPTADLPLVHHAAETSLHAAESALYDLIANFPNLAMRVLLRVVLMPFGIVCAKPSDELTRAAAATISEPTATRDRLTSGIYVPRDSELGKLDQAFRLMTELEPLRQEMRRARVRTAEEAEARGILSGNEAERMREALALVRDVSSVDDFAPEELLSRRDAATRSAA